MIRGLRKKSQGREARIIRKFCGSVLVGAAQAADIHQSPHALDSVNLKKSYGLENLMTHLLLVSFPRNSGLVNC